MKQPTLENSNAAPNEAALPANMARKPALSPVMAGLLLVAALLTIFQIFQVYLLVIKNNNDPATDFHLFLRFASIALDGQSPYRLYQPTAEVYQGDLHFVYVYWFVFLYEPFARLEPTLAFYLWATINLLLLAGAVWLAWRTYLTGWKFYWLLPLYCLALAICSNAIINGHSTVIMLLGLSACAYLYKRQRYFLAGLPALVFLIKPQITFLAGAAILALALYQAVRTKNLAWRFGTWPPVVKWLAGSMTSSLGISVFSLIFEPDWPLQLAGSFNLQQFNGQVQNDGVYLVFFKAIFPSWLEFLGWQQPWIALVSIPVIGALLVWGAVRLWQWRENFPVFLAIGLSLTLAVTFYSHVYDFPPLLPALFVVLWQIGKDWRAGQKRAALLRLGCLGLLFILQPISADYRWFYSQSFVITILALTVPPAKADSKAETIGTTANNRNKSAEI